MKNVGDECAFLLVMSDGQSTFASQNNDEQFGRVFVIWE